MRYCTACLSILPEGAGVCPACGLPILDIAPDTPLSQEDLSAKTYSDYDEIPYLDASSMPVSHRTPAPPIATPTTAHTLQATGVSGPDAMPFASTSTPGRRSRWRTIGRVVLICFLALLLLLESLVFTAYLLVIRPIHFEEQAVAVTNQYLMTQGQQLAKAWSKLSPMQVYARATSGTPTINDPLTGPAGNVWYNYHTGKDGCSYEQGAYHLHLSTAGGYSCLGYGTFFQDVVFQADITILHADYAGLGIRCTPSDGYTFFISPAGSYQFDLYNQSNVKGITFGNNSAINRNTGQMNQITVIAVGNNFYFYANQQPIARAQDSDYPLGQLAFTADSSFDNTDVIFSNVKVWKLP